VLELIAAQPFAGQLFRRRHMYRAAKCARLPESHVVDQNDEHIGRVGWRLDLEAGRRSRIPGVKDGAVRIRWLGSRQDRAVSRRAVDGGCRGVEDSLWSPVLTCLE